MFSYILPSAISLPLGYNCRIFLPINNLILRLNKVLEYQIAIQVKAYREGSKFLKKIVIDQNNNTPNIDFVIPDHKIIQNLQVMLS